MGPGTRQRNQIFLKNWKIKKNISVANTTRVDLQFAQAEEPISVSKRQAGLIKGVPLLH
jgi:hypothetical protein